MELSELLDSIPPARGRRTRLVAEKRRDIVASDIEAMDSARPLEQVTPVQQLRHQHHLLARLLAEGKQITEAACITGYSIAYVSRLKTQDRAFRDLIDYYRSQVAEVFVDVHQRLAGLGLNTVEELQERLAEKPESFSNRELMELGELCMDRSGNGPTSTQRSVVQILTTEDIERLKNEVSRRSTGKILDITPNYSRVRVGGAGTEGTVAQDATPRAAGKGDELSKEGGEVSVNGSAE